jgi:ComF family protein
MARQLARLEWPADVLHERALVTPVPLSRERLRERGYNQAACLATAIARHWRLPAAECVQRTRSTASQVRLTPSERLRNVAGAFAVPAEAEPMLQGRHVVLVDDVVTTAATLNACAAALVAAGARIVSYVTFGRARS